MLLFIKQYSINSIKVVKPYYENLIRTRQSTSLFLPEKFHGQRSLAGYSPWCCKELDMTERLHFLSLWKPLRDWICFVNVKQDSRLPCPSLSLRVCSNSCPFSQWCHPTISSSVTHFSFLLCLSQYHDLFQWFDSTSDGQRMGASASASVFQMNIQGSFPLGLTGLISLWSKGLSGVFSSTTIQKHQFFSAQPFSLWSNSHIHTWLLEKP